MSVRRMARVMMSLLVVTSFVLMACAPAPQQAAPAATQAPAEEATTAPAAEQAEQIELNVWTRFPEMQELLQDLGDAYNAENPNVKVVVTLFAQRALDEKMAIALPAGEAGDIIENGGVSIYPFYKQGFIEPVPEDFVAWLREHVSGDMFEPGEDGVIFGVPLFTGIQTMFYNKDHFEEAGLECCPETVDELMDYAQKLTQYDDKGNITRAGLDLRLGGGGYGVAEKFWALAMVPYGVRPLVQVEDGKWKAGYEGEGGVKALQFYIDALYKYKVDSAEVKSDAEGFGLGATSMFQRESWVIGYLAESAPDINYGTFLMVKGPGGWGTGGAPSDLAVSKSSKNKEAAFDFIEFCMSEENQLKLLADTGWLPTRTDADYSSVIDEQPAFKPFLDSLDTPGYDVQLYPLIEPSVEIVGKMADQLVPAFGNPDLLDNPEGLQSIVDSMIKETNRILEDYELLAE